MIFLNLVLVSQNRSAVYVFCEDFIPVRYPSTVQVESYLDTSPAHRRQAGPTHCPTSRRANGGTRPLSRCRFAGIRWAGDHVSK